MAIPYPNLTGNISSFPDLLTQTSQISGGEVGIPFMLGYMILFIITITALVGFRSSFKYTEIERLLPATFFISFVSSVFEAALGLIPSGIPAVPLIAMGLTIALLFFKGDNV
jgi:ABC-type multidrug transport system permease subunit